MTSSCVGNCNKCGQERELVFEDAVCQACNDALDQRWSTAAQTDWVLLTTYVPERIKAVMESLLRSLDKTPARAGTCARVHMYRNITYAEMKSHWARPESAPELTGYIFPTAEDTVNIRSLAAKLTDSEAASIIRPATSEEVGEHDKYLREADRSQVIEEIFQKWGFDDEGRPLERFDADGKLLDGFDDQGRRIDATVDPEIDGRKAAANAEIERVLQERGLEYSEE